MNVVNREGYDKKSKIKLKHDLIRRDATTGIRGAITKLPIRSNPLLGRPSAKAPRYQFGKDYGERKRKFSMGPPSGPPPNVKRRLVMSSSKLDSTTSSKLAPRVLANDSSAIDSFLCTPKNRPSAIRYISSSSRGGYSGTRSARSASTSMVEANVILAISEGRGKARGEIGMAAVDLRHPHLVLCQFSDTLLYTHTMTKINYFNPVEIIVPHTFCEGVQPNQLYRLIRDQYPLITITSVPRRYYNDSVGRQHIQSLCAPEYSAVYLQVLHKFYALTVAAAVLTYVEYIQCIVFARESLKIEYHSSEDTMIIDVGTATQLELVQPLLPSAGATCCLLGVLGPTYTMGGIRALRAAILQPSFKKEFIEARLDAVQELMENDTGIMTALQDVIKKLLDIDKILLLCIENPSQQMDNGEAQLNQTLLLKTTMDVVPNLVAALMSAESGRLRKIKMDFENPHYQEITNRIRMILQDDAHLEKGATGSIQRCFAVKPEINGLLDVARRTYSELVDDIDKIVEELSKTYDLPIIMKQNVMKGFHIMMPIAPKNRRNFNVDDLPSIFIQVNFNGVSVTMTTENLVVLDHQAKEALNEIQKMSNIVISTLLKDLRPFMASLYKLCENVAELDILIALAQISTVGSYIRPEFSDYLEIKNSIHPLLDYNCQAMPVPNDIFANAEFNFTIITGPNMGGKSIYIKQVAIMQVMAQLGCYIPATKAVLRLCDRIFSRVGFNDSVELNASTYVIEMKEVQHILKGLTPSSLVIIDELCRGTCSEEGASIAWAICEELLASDAYTFFTTHFLYLTRLENLYYNVVNRHTAVTQETVASQNQQRLVYRHKIEAGVTKIEQYGLALAEKTSLPEDTVNLAKKLAEIISSRRKSQSHSIHGKSTDRLLYEINAKVSQALRQNESPATIKNIIQKFKSDYPEIIENLREQNIASIYDNNSSRPLTTTSNDNKNIFSDSNILNETTTRNEFSFVNNSITDDVQAKSVEINSNFGNKYTAVKSSTELLNTLLNHADIESNNTECTNDYNKNSEEDNNQISNEINNNTRQFDNNYSNTYPKTFDNYSALEESYANTRLTTPQNTQRTSISSDSDTEIALTQAIAKSSDSQSSNILSSDEELMKEAIQEINQDFLNCILTPPEGFRDD